MLSSPKKPVGRRLSLSSSSANFSSPSSSDSGDDGESPEAEGWGDMVKFVSFNMLTKTFDLEWGDGGIRTHKATDMLSDWTMDALRFLYDKYFWEAGMIDWINHIVL